MAMGRMDISDLKRLRDKLARNCSAEQIDKFCESCAKRIAGQLLRDVVRRTPIGEYDKPVSFVTHDGKQVNFTPKTGKKGGTLASSWKAGTIGKDGTTYTITVENNALSDNGVPYAIYVEFGHRTWSGGWVEGRKMLTITEEELKEAVPGFLDRKVAEFLRRCVR